MNVDGKFVGVSFSQAKDALLRGRGAVVRESSQWVVRQRKAPGPLRVVLGILALGVAIVVVAIGATVLEGAGLDLMAYRKGPLLVAMVALALGVGAWTLVDRLAAASLGREVARALPGPVQLTDHGDALVLLFWQEKGRRVGAAFRPADAAGRQALLGQATGTEAAPAHA